MFKSVFSKTLYERRWGILWWSLAVLGSTVLVMSLFPVFQDSFGQQLNDVPDSLKAVLGEAADYQRIEGFIELQVFLQMIFLTVIYGIIVCTNLIAGEEGDGRLQTLLAQPVSRGKVYTHKLLAAFVIIGGISLAVFTGVWLGALIINEPVDLGRVLQGTGALWLTSMVFGLVAYALGGVTGRRGLTGALAGAFAFVAYLVSSLVNTAEVLRFVNYLSPLRYFNNPRVMDQGLHVHNVVVLVSACLVLALIGWYVFRERDVYQR